MAEQIFSSVEINPTVPVKASVIWLHGLGADGHDFAGIIPQLNLPEDLGVRFVFPHAPVQPITLNAGMAMPAWFDIHGLDMDSPQDEQGIKKTDQVMKQLIERELALGIDSKHIVLAGFSQGGAVALYTGLRYPQPLAGIIALSTFLPLAEKTADEIGSANRHIAIFMAHGQHDPLLSINLGKYSCDFLRYLGCRVDWRTYPIEHSVSIEEIHDISHWLMNILAAKLMTNH